jgi:hypothetical protein
MADIDIVPKHRSYTWLWIVIALVIIAVAWFALSGHRGTRATGASGELLAPGAAPTVLALTVSV